ncbi:hypothetical protein EGW08_000817, partial [Elysia chlorotica]
MKSAKLLTLSATLCALLAMCMHARGTGTSERDTARPVSGLVGQGKRTSDTYTLASWADKHQFYRLIGAGGKNKNCKDCGARGRTSLDREDGTPRGSVRPPQISIRVRVSQDPNSSVPRPRRPKSGADRPAHWTFADLVERTASQLGRQQVRLVNR